MRNCSARACICVDNVKIDIIANRAVGIFYVIVTYFFNVFTVFTFFLDFFLDAYYVYCAGKSYFTIEVS